VDFTIGQLPQATITQSEVMSHTPADQEHSHPIEAEAPHFDRDEVHQFEEDDREAGVNIGKMLSFLFIYTVVAMSITAYATYAHWMGE
jgi:hypothetical protein